MHVVQSVWQAAERQGFDVIVYDRNVANHEKKIDTDILRELILKELK